MYTVEAESIIKDFEIENIGIDSFLDSLQLNIISRTENTLEFDLVNCHPSIANTLRRILISKVPTMAISDVLMYENTTVFPDEYIAHRLGLVPLDVNPEQFDFFINEEAYNNVLNFKLNKVNTEKDVINITSNDIEFIPIEGQEHFSVKLKQDVIICKVSPGKQLQMAFTAKKGTGEQHAKWSPVSLCSYKLMPRIILEKVFTGEEAKELQKSFSPGVIEIIDGKAVVVNPRIDSMSREALRHNMFKGSVKILRESGWFCFTIETILMDPLETLKMGLKELIRCCADLKDKISTVGEKYSN
ncbi:DNA-directed RNA polymerase core subunit rpc40 [Glugoides intestinalis]